jgi:hypothetical protein
MRGDVVAVQVAADGDLHIALGEATDQKPGVVVCEVPAMPQWCEIRKIIFSWTRTRFPLHIRSTRELTINETPIITVIGKAFWDVGHAPKDQSNRRKRLPPVCCLGDSSGDGVARRNRSQRPVKQPSNRFVVVKVREPAS